MDSSRFPNEENSDGGCDLSASVSNLSVAEKPAPNPQPTKEDPRVVAERELQAHVDTICSWTKTSRLVADTIRGLAETNKELLLKDIKRAPYWLQYTYGKLLYNEGEADRFFPSIAKVLVGDKYIPLLFPVGNDLNDVYVFFCIVLDVFMNPAFTGVQFMKTLTARTVGGICKIDNLHRFEYLLGIRIPPYRFIGAEKSIYPLCCSLRCRDWVKHFWILDPSREFVSFADPEPIFVNREFEPVWLEFRSIGSPDCQLLELSVELLVQAICGDDARFALLTQHKDKPVDYAKLGFHRHCFEEVPVLPPLSSLQALSSPATASEKNSNL